MHPIFATRNEGAQAIPIWFVTPKTSASILDGLDAKARAFARASGFDGKTGKHALLPNGEGKLAGVLFGLEDADEHLKDLFLPGRLPGLLPPGIYRFANEPHHARLGALAFALGAYRFDRYRKPAEPKVRLLPPEGVDGVDLSRVADAVTMARDLINTPANDMGPAELEAAARALANRHGATFGSVIGDELLTQNFPLIHAVGAGSSRAPRLIDITWGSERDPKVTLVGKGVCFDTGGLDIKPESAMLLMKKDMGGAATVLALAHMIMDRVLKVRLRVLIPAVENSISGAAFRPLDVYRSHKGLCVEIGNTDAEGRLVLADALALADEESPDLLIDMGTLTGAARVALGPELPPFYTNDEALAVEVARHAAAENDPVWRLPLWQNYDKMLDSKVADVNNVSSSNFAGSITCALFLKRFVESAKAFLHFDIYAWVPSARSGRPEGGECQVARALYALLAQRYG